MSVRFKKKKRRRAQTREHSALASIGATERPEGYDSDEERKKAEAKRNNSEISDEEPQELDELKLLRNKKKAKMSNSFATVNKLKEVIKKHHGHHGIASDRSAMRDTTAEDAITCSVETAEERLSDTKNKETKRVGTMMGPSRAPANLRIMSRFDYQPDLCKDWKETGYCGYGDSCKFMHDRGDYKSGAQLEKEWEEEQKKKRKIALGELVDEGEEDWAIHSDDEELPFACLICREDFVTPVVTKCGHYFCEACALKRYAKSSRCAVCGAQTLGVFNTAHAILKNHTKLTSERERIADEAEAAAQSGQAVRDSMGFAASIATQQGWAP